MMVFSKKSMLFVVSTLIAFYSMAQSVGADTVTFPPQKIHLSNGYYSMGAEGHRANYDVSYKTHSGSRGIESVSFDIKFTNNTNTRYCFTRPNESVDCYRKTGGIGKLNDLRQPSSPALAYIDFSYDIYYKDKFLRSTGDNSDKYMAIASTEPITIQINLPSNEVNKNAKLEEILKNMSIKNLQIREYTFAKEVKDYLYSLSELDYTISEAQNKQVGIELKKVQLAKEEQVEKAKLEKTTTEMTKGLESKTVELEKQKAQLATKQTEDSQIADEKRKTEYNRIAEEKRKAEDNRIAEEKRKAEDNRIAEERRKTENNRIAEEKRKAEDRRIAEEKRKAEDSRIAEEKRKAEDSRISEEKRKTEDSHIAEEKLRIAEEKLRLTEEKLRVSEEQLRVSEEQHREDMKLIESISKITATNLKTPNPVLETTKPLNVNRLRLTCKALVPNILGYSLELVPSTPNNKLSFVVDYSNLNASSFLSTVIGEDVGSIIKFNYLAIGTNIYLNKKKRAGGPYFGLRYQSIKIQETRDGDINPNFEGMQKAGALLFGLTTAGHVSFGFEIGAGMPIGDFTGYQIQKDVSGKLIKETLSGSFSENLGFPVIPVLNLKLGFAF